MDLNSNNSTPAPTRDELIEAIRKCANEDFTSRFPLHVFPLYIQGLINDFLNNENSFIEFWATAILCATSSALGNAYRLNIKGNWDTNAAMYTIFIGRRGLGKTPPIKTIFKPIKDFDNRRLHIYAQELERYNNTPEKDRGQKPRLKKMIISDFTPEAMLQAHSFNPRSITIDVDEIMGMFNTVNRYNQSQLITQLLSAWSGISIDVIRKTDDMPLYINQPHINIIGTTQTKYFKKLLEKGYEDNGLLDRFLFVFPHHAKIPKWRLDDKGYDDTQYSAYARWAGVINKILDLDYDVDKPHMLFFSDEARRYFYNWWNDIIDKINETDDEDELEARKMKQCIHSARLSLLIQVLRWASEGTPLCEVDIESVKGGIAISEYFEDSYDRLYATMTKMECESNATIFVNNLPDKFTTFDAQRLAKSDNIPMRTMYQWLKKLEQEGVICKPGRGLYEKVQIK